MSTSVSKDSGISVASVAIQPPSHPTYDLRGIIQLALAEDSADFGIMDYFIINYLEDYMVMFGITSHSL